MTYEKLNLDWNAEPNAPEPTVSARGNTLTVSFYLNYFLYDRFHEDDKGILTFKDCYKYSFNSMNDEGYYRGQYRYKYNELPWGEFYLLNTSVDDFPKDSIILDESLANRKLNHYIFFFRDNTLECIAETFEIKFEKWPESHLLLITAGVASGRLIFILQRLRLQTHVRPHTQPLHKLR